MFSSRFMLFATLKKIGVKKFRGGGGVLKNIFLEKQFFSHFTFYVIFNIKKNIEKVPPSLTG